MPATLPRLMIEPCVVFRCGMARDVRCTTLQSNYPNYQSLKIRLENLIHSPPDIEVEHLVKHGQITAACTTHHALARIVHLGMDL